MVQPNLAGYQKLKVAADRTVASDSKGKHSNRQTPEFEQHYGALKTRACQANHANTSVQYYAVNLFFDLLTTVINKSKLWLTTVLDEHFTELFI